MKEVKLDDTDRGLLNLLQANFPLSREPFVDLGSSLGLEEKEVIQRITRLKEAQIIRSIGPVFDSRSLGYKSTLVAMRVPDERLEEAAQMVNEHPGVSHNYGRAGALNLWFTLAVPPGNDLKSELQALANKVCPEQVLDLPAVRHFKIGLFFDMAESGPQVNFSNNSPKKPRGALQALSTLSSSEKAAISEIQQDIPLLSRPFDAMAEHVGMEVNEFLRCCRRLKERGVMRRFGASIRHQNVGFAANAMVCWRVPPLRVEEAGEMMSVFREVSHCYERKTNQSWPYNVFTMIHGKTKEGLQRTIERIAAQSGIQEYEALFTIKEFKKERVKFSA